LDAATANSPVTLQDDDDSELLRIEEGSSGGGSGGGGGGGGAVVVDAGGASPFDIPLVVVAIAAVAGVAFLTWRFTDSRNLTLVLTGVAGVVALFLGGEAIAPGSIIDTVVTPIAENVGEVVPVLALGGGALAGYYLYLRFIKGNEKRDIKIVGRLR
jgi:hypothetical protein